MSFASKEWTLDLTRKVVREAKKDRPVYFDEYSDSDEVIIGKWINGKPIYRRIIKLSITTLSSNITLVNNVSAWSPERFVTLRTITTGNGTNNQEGADGYHGVTRYQQSTDTIIYIVFGNYTNITEAYLLAEYTKTIDAPNSFEPSMIKTNKINYQVDNLNIGFQDYSEGEIIVGRWIDGKPIYRKVFNVTFPASGKNSEIPLANIGVQNVADIVNISGTILKTDGYTIIINAGTFNDSAFMDCNLSRQILWLYSTGNAGNCSGKGIVEYTKTTDAPDSFSMDALLQQYNFNSNIENVVLDEYCSPDDVEEVLG